MKRVAVLGFGLIGASIAAALRSRAAPWHVTAIDVAESVSSPAVLGHSDARVDSADRTAAEEAFERSDLTVLAAPIHVIVDHLGPALARAPLVTDCGSTKRLIVERALALDGAERFVPGHPLAGGPRGGADGARADLFVGRPWVLCPARASADAQREVSAFVSELGAIPITMSAAEHDRAVALTSHATQIVASALVALSQRRGAERVEGSGFDSATRAAGGNPAVWEDIFATNGDEVAEALRELCTELEQVARALDRSPPSVSKALELLQLAREARERG